MKTSRSARHFPALLTDLYELTMAYGYWKNGVHDKEAVFHLIFRKNPFGGGFSVACGLSDAIDFLNPLAFTDDEIAYLGTLTGGDVRLYLNANHPISRLNSPVHLSSSSEGRHA
jgi:nicotinic acid phosphoribosyltransferase